MKLPIHPLVQSIAWLALGHSLLTPTLRATDGTWTNLSGGAWNDGGNWSGGTIADGIDATANLNTLNLTAGIAITLGGNRTIGNLTFGDTTPSDHGWTISGDILTLDVTSGSSLITVNNLGTGMATISSEISGNDGLTKAGAGWLLLSGANTYSGGTTLSGSGRVLVGNNAAFGSGTLTFSGTNRLTSDSGTARTFANAVSVGGTALLGASTTYTGALTFNGAGTLTADSTLDVTGTVTYAGAIGGAYRLSKAGTGTLVLTNANTHTGGTTVSAGFLRAGNNSALGTGTLVLAGGTFSSDSTAARTFANAVTLAGNVTLGNATNNGTLTFNGAGTLTGNRTLTLASAVTFANAIGGGFGLTKAGTGTLTFSAVNTYTGTTTVSAGTLVLSGSGSIASSSLVDVQSGAILNTSALGSHTFGNTQTVMGRGTIIGNTVIQGTLAPGSSPGILTFSNHLTLATTTNSVFEIQNTGLVRGTDYDGVNVTGLLTYDGTLTLTLASLVPAGGTYDLFSFGSVAGNFTSVVFSSPVYAGTFNFNSGVWSATDTNGSGQTFSFDQATGDVIISAIPEPSTTLLLAGGLMALLLRRRRQA